MVRSVILTSAQTLRTLIFVLVGGTIFTALFALLLIPIAAISLTSSALSAITALLHLDTLANASLSVARDLLASIRGFETEPTLNNQNTYERVKYAGLSTILAATSAITTSALTAFLTACKFAFEVRAILNLLASPGAKFLGVATDERDIFAEQIEGNRPLITTLEQLAPGNDTLLEEQPVLIIRPINTPSYTDNDPIPTIAHVAAPQNTHKPTP